MTDTIGTSAPLPAPPNHRHPLPSLVVPMDAPRLMDTLDRAARRGRLAGFAPAKSPALFSVDAFGTPFDKRLDAYAASDPAGVRLTFSLHTQPRTPALFFIALAATIWPGVWLTDSMLRSYIPSYDFATWMWYLPLTILPMPFVIRTCIQRSNTSAYAHALEQIANIARETGATPADTR